MSQAIISFAESGVRDLEEVQVWYVEQGLKDVATRLVEEIFQRLFKVFEAKRENPIENSACSNVS